MPKKSAKTSDSKKFKLSIDLVPMPSWGKSLSKILTGGQWKKIRTEVPERNGNKCEICSSLENIQCHEHWKFDDETQTQTLAGLGTICRMCHFAMHMGRAGQIVDIEVVKSHFMKINQCDRAALEKHAGEAGEIFLKRSSHQWRIDYGEYAGIVAQTLEAREKRKKKKEGK
ncbi:MAG: HNH endonuclease [Gammaproteobacteria bacterium]